MDDKVDVEATVTGGGPTSQAGAIRYGISVGVSTFVEPQLVEKMRIGETANFFFHISCKESKITHLFSQLAYCRETTEPRKGRSQAKKVQEESSLGRNVKIL